MDWNADNIARFWDYISSRRDLRRTYFTYQVGEGVAAFLAHAISLHGASVLDYGCGRGDLVERLLARGALVSGFDNSEASVRATNSRYQGRANWRRATVAASARDLWPAEEFDAVTCIETIEHLLPDDLERVLADIGQVLKSGGVALFTTPNRENLLESTVCCPQCHTEFHRWQHVRSWSRVELQTILEHHGLEVVFCHALDFAAFQPRRRPSWKDSSPRTLAASVRRRYAALLELLLPRPFPRGRLFSESVRRNPQVHLAAVARKPGSPGKMVSR